MNENTCRLCEEQFVEGASFSLSYKNKYNLVNIVFELTSLQIKITDGMPNSICESCAEKLVDYHIFRQRVLAVEMKLLMKAAAVNKSQNDNEFQNAKVDCVESINNSTHDLGKEKSNGVVRRALEENSPVFIKKRQPLDFGPTEATFGLTDTENAYKSEKDRKKFICDQCGRGFPVPSKFLSHYRSIHLKEYQRKACPHCPRTFKASSTTRYSLSRHIKSAHECIDKATPKHPTIKCSECGDLFAGPIEMYEHSKVHEPESVETIDGLNLNCDECKIDLKSYDLFVAHMQTCHNFVNEKDVRPFRCRWCGERSKKLVGLYSHVRLIHKCDEGLQDDVVPSDMLNRTRVPKSNASKFLCMVCGKVLSSLSAYNNHMVVHSGVKSFSCDYCPAKFSGKPLLQSHILTHTQERKYRCSEPGCEKAFKQCAHLKSHLKTHGIGIKEKYACSVCNKEFLFRGSLAEHMWVHKKDQTMPHVCKKCGKGFRWNCKLELHLKRGRCAYA